MVLTKMQHYKQYLLLEGFDSDFIDQADQSLELLIHEMEVVNQYPIDDETFPSFNPNLHNYII